MHFDHPPNPWGGIGAMFTLKRINGRILKDRAVPGRGYCAKNNLS
ncbi:hypothetical protein MHH28_08345 [Paenibacillus sp. FSL K6-1217]